MAQEDLVAVVISNSHPAVRRLLRTHNFRTLKEMSKSQLVLEDFQEDLNHPALQAIMSKLDAVQLAQERQQKVQFAAAAEPERQSRQQDSRSANYSCSSSRMDDTIQRIRTVAVGVALLGANQTQNAMHEIRCVIDLSWWQNACFYMPNVTTTSPSLGDTLTTRILWKWREMEREWVWMKREYKVNLKIGMKEKRVSESRKTIKKT